MLFLFRFILFLMSQSTIFQLCLDRSSWVGPVLSRAATFTRVKGNVLSFCKIGLSFKPTLACDKHHGLLIEFPNEKYCLSAFPNSTVFDKVSSATRIIVDMLNRHVTMP